MNRETPWKPTVFLFGAFRLVCWCGLYVCAWGICRLSSRVEVIQEAKGIMPLQRNIFVREPCVFRADIRVDEAAREEGMQLVDQQAKVRNPWELYLASSSTHNSQPAYNTSSNSNMLLSTYYVGIRLIVRPAVAFVQPYLEGDAPVPGALSQSACDVFRSHRSEYIQDARCTPAC